MAAYQKHVYDSAHCRGLQSYVLKAFCNIFLRFPSHENTWKMFNTIFLPSLVSYLCFKNVPSHFWKRNIFQFVSLVCSSFFLSHTVQIHAFVLIDSLMLRDANRHPDEQTSGCCLKNYSLIMQSVSVIKPWKYCTLKEVIFWRGSGSFPLVD